MKTSRVSLLAAAAVSLLAACHRPVPLADGGGVVYDAPGLRVTWSSVALGDTVVTATSPLTLMCGGCDSLSATFAPPDSLYPVYTSDQPLIDALYNRSVGILANDGGSLRSHYPYAVWLASAYLNPAASADTLRSRLDARHVARDTDSDALPWPVSSDRGAWILAAAELCRVTGDSSMLAEAADVARHTLDEDFDVCLDRRAGLLYGSQTYLLPQPMLYPEWAEPVDIWQSPCLGTNMIASAACRETAGMSRRLGLAAERYDSLAAVCAENMQTAFWQPNLGYYSAYAYGYPYRVAVQATDNMAQMIGIVHGMVAPDTAALIIRSTPVFDAGVPTMFPMPRAYRDASEEATRPVVQAYWNLAAARVHDTRALTAGVAWLCAMAAAGPRHELTAPGVVALVFRVFAGMRFGYDGITFAPFVPSTLPGTKRIGRFRYRDSRLDIAVRGYGDSVASFSIDGIPHSRPFFDASKNGFHTVDIALCPSRRYRRGTLNVTARTYMPVTPEVKWVTRRDALITNFDPQFDYELLVNGVFTTMMAARHYRMFNTTEFTAIGIVPVEGSTWTGFSQKPYQFVPDGARTVADYTGSGIDLRALGPGTYMVRFTYRPDTAGTSVAYLECGRAGPQPVVFLPSRRAYDRSSSVTITVGRVRGAVLRPVDGKLPHIKKIVFTRIS